MFSSPGCSVAPEPGQGYDFHREDNLAKWKGVFVNSLTKVLEQVHPSLEARQDALDYVENLILRLLGMLCEPPPPHMPQDVEERVRRTFPTPIDRWAIRDARDAIDKGKKKSPLVLPVDKIHQLLQKEVLQHKIDWQVTLFIVGVLEYISADILKLAGNYVKNIRHVEISYEDVRVAMYADKVLMDMFHQDGAEGPQTSLRTVVSQTYEESVRDLINDERQYLRDLHMIIKVFREEISKLTQDRAELEMLFSNITDIYETTVNLLGSLEDIVEIAEDKQTPTVGSCLEEFAEAEEFHAYIKYAADIISPECRDVLTRLLSRPESNAALRAAGHGFKEAVKYYLPKLLMQPVWHCFLYVHYIEVLQKRSPNHEDRFILEQVQGLFQPVEIKLKDILETNKCKRDSSLLQSMQSRTRRQAALEKTSEMQKTVDGWDQRDIGQCCNEFIREDILWKVGSNGRRLTERRALLFDGLLVLCKPNTGKRVSVSVAAVAVGGNHSAHQSELRLKERYFIRKVDINDREDTEDLKNAFEITTRDHSNVILVAKGAEEKNSWMADLVMLNTKSMLERTLDSILLDEERKHPLKLPPPHLYKFAEPDSPENIVVEARENGGVPLIRGATLEKLVERLTYHIYADPAFVRTFLTTYRSFCSPQELLTLLIERFEIPDPSKVYDEDDRPTSGCKSIPREDFKRYRKEFCQPVQFRVLNVLRHWVDHHYYDFERNNSLLARLTEFCNTVSDNCKSMKKWVDSVLKIVNRKKPSEQKSITFSFERSPPAIEWHLKVPEEEWGILTLHPIEIARQLTLLEFELYRNVKPSELVGSVWTKKDKEETSPNLLKSIKHTTNFTRWLMKIIVEAENFEERVAIVSRAIEIMMVLQDLNNFNGVIAVVSALLSASVYRLHCTFAQLTTRLDRALNEASKLNADHYKVYQEKLRSINPPCVPFLGMYLTNILHIEEGNSDFLPESQLINFSKRRMVAEIIGEIQQYQNQPYCLSVELGIRRFLENLCPFEPDMSDPDIDTYLFNMSNKIEPKQPKDGKRQPIRAPRRWPDLNLKSPGIKARSLSGKLPAPLQAVASSVRLHDPPTATQELPVASELPETPPHGSIPGDQSVFAPVFIGGPKACQPSALSPGSPGPSLNMSCLSLGSPGNSPQLSSPGQVASLQQPPSHFGFNSGTIIASLAGIGSSGSPGAPPSPSHHLPLGLGPGMPPPPLPPRSHRRRDSCLPGDSPHQARQAPNAPILPPRDGGSPPPLPPRRDLPPPRFPATLNHSTSALLARRNSTLENSCPINTAHSRRHMSFNGPSPTKKLPPAQPPNGSITPKLPPKPQIPGRSPATMFNFNAPASTSQPDSKTSS